MRHAKKVPAGVKIVTSVAEVPGGSIEYRLSGALGKAALGAREVRREIEHAVRKFRAARSPSR